MEIERKFLVAQPPDDLGTWSAQRIEQGYLAITPDVEVRVRRRDRRATLTVKSAPGLVRVEEELAIESARFDALWALTEGRRVVKTRHSTQAGPGVVLELDVYEGALQGLRTLEVEFADEAAARAFAPPRGWSARSPAILDTRTRRWRRRDGPEPSPDAPRAGAGPERSHTGPVTAVRWPVTVSPAGAG
ncbi:CYTH domain-containing protein [Baekduia soli]|uniref:CYTH domain-containing protein n=1 Tax=Baekduia soli TaxID=496014 RepID=UPI001E44E91D|nr:CYTH domain-containing protein [Baekduia soli]